MRRGFTRFGFCVERPHLRRSYCRVVRRASAVVSALQVPPPSYQGFSICGPVQALRRLAPQPVGPSAFRQNQAISAGLCHVPGFALLPCVRRAPFRLFFIFRSGVAAEVRKKRAMFKTWSVFRLPAAWRNAPPVSLCSLFTMPIIAGKTGNRWQSYFSGKT